MVPIKITVAAVAGHVASGMPIGWKPEVVAVKAVAIARAIVAEVERTEPTRQSMFDGPVGLSDPEEAGQHV